TGPFPRIGGRVSGIMTPDRFQEESGVLDTAGQRTDLVEGGGESDEAVAAHTSVRRLYPDDAAQGGGLADGPTGVGAESPQRRSGGDRHGRAAGRPPWHSVWVPGVPARPVGGVLGGGTHRKLVEIRLPDQHRPDLAETLDHVGVIGRDRAGEDPAGGG